MINNSRMNTKDWFLDRILAICVRYSPWMRIALAFLVGVLINLYSEASVKDISGILYRMFSLDYRQLNILSWLALFVIMLLTVVRFILQIVVQRRNYMKRLAILFSHKIDATLQPFHKGRVGWGSALTLQSCPDIYSGWKIEDVRVEYETTMYTVKSDYAHLYEEYLKGDFREKNVDNSVRLMLTRNPVAFSDAPTLRLKVQQTQWSQVRFYQEWIFVQPGKRTAHISEVLSGPISFPNTLCLHLIIVTTDGYLLLTRSGPQVAYYPNLWTLSIGEQLDVADLTGPEEEIAVRWLKRALWEELSLESSEFSIPNARVLAVHLESDIVNCAVIALAILTIDRALLNAKIDKHIKRDYEFQTWDFIEWNQIPDELINPTKEYHPSTGLRMFYAGLYKMGAPGLYKRLLKIENA